MLKFNTATLVTAFLLAIATSSIPAAATQTSTALSICVSRGTDCTVTNKKGGYEICVNNTGGRQCVQCPALTESNQTCSVAKGAAKGSVTGATAILKGKTLNRR
jgi:hypothetical protein